MFLLDVKHTVAARAFWPAKPYHDDIDFPRICEEKELVAAKCQWLFLHKVSEPYVAFVIVLVPCASVVADAYMQSIHIIMSFTKASHVQSFLLTAL